MWICNALGLLIDQDGLSISAGGRDGYYVHRTRSTQRQVRTVLFTFCCICVIASDDPKNVGRL